MLKSAMFHKKVNREGVLKFLKKEVFPFTPLEIQAGVKDADIIAIFEGIFHKASCEDRAIITFHYGLRGKSLTLREIGRLFGLSPERVRQREVKALIRANRTKTKEAFKSLVSFL